MIHFLYRKNILNVSVHMRSSNVINTLWADWGFLKILSVKVANDMNLNDVQIDITLNIRSAHIVP